MIGKTIGHYKIVDKLGEGGMGAVYKAEDTTLNRLVAIKALSSHLAENEEARERFVREAQAASAINHPNITTVFELLEEDDSHYISMEYVDGKTIRDMVESGHVSIRKAVDIILQAAEALSAAHRKGILHRDVKSANIMVSMEGNVKVMDFGLAHLEERSQLTRTGTTMGTLAYSSPEQLTGSPYDERSEIWSLGVVFYELLTGELPFKSPSEGELLFSIINNEQDSPNTCREDAPESVCGVINKMLLKKTELRYQNCGELISDLKAIQSELETTTVQISAGATKSRARTRTIVTTIAGSVSLIAFYLLFLAPKPSETIRIAVQPFDVIGSETEVSFGVQVAIEIHGKLGSIGSIEVVDFYDESQYSWKTKSIDQIKRELNVDYLIKATVQRATTPDGGIRVRLNPRLISTSDASTAWTPDNPFDVIDQEIFDLQSTLVEEVANALQLVLSESESQTIEQIPTNNMIAYNAYQEARTLWRNNSDRDTRLLYIDLLEHVVRLDSTFATAWAKLSEIYSRTAFSTRILDTHDAYTKAQAAAEKAIRFGPTIADGYRAMGLIYYRRDLDWVKASELFETAIEKQPNYALAVESLGWSLRRQGRWEESLPWLKMAAELDPLSESGNRNLYLSYLSMRQYKLAEQYINRAIEQWPSQSTAYVFKELLYLLSDGDIDKSRAVLENAPEDMAIRLTRLGSYNFYRQMVLRIHADYYEQFLPQVRSSIIYSESSPFTLGNHYIARAETAFGLGDLERSIAYWDSLLIHKNTVGSLPNSRTYTDAQLLADTGTALVMTGDIEKGIQYGLEAKDLYPISMDAGDAYGIVVILIEIYLLAKEYEKAMDHLEILLGLSGWYSIHIVQIDPLWAPVLKHPRFIEIMKKHN